MRVRWVALFLAGIGGLASAATAANAEGAHLYRVYCARCHGSTGRGDGPDAAIFVIPPRDLRAMLPKGYTRDQLVGWVRDGRTLPLALDRVALAERAKQVEDLVAYLTELPSINWKLARLGSALYATRCEACHGVRGNPRTSLPAGVKPPRDLSDPAFQQSMRDDELIAVVRHGSRGMPALTPRIPASYGPPLAAFIRLFSPGFALYARDCANCHGDDGHGVADFAAAIRLPTVIFDRQYFTTHDPDYVRSKVWHMVGEHKPTMPHYGTILSDAQARGIVAYIEQMIAGTGH